MKILKFLVIVIALFATSTFVYGYLKEKEVIDIIVDYYDRTPSKISYNDYKKDIDVDFVKLTNDFEADNKQELLNIYYTIVYSGIDEFTFYCNKEYTDCIEEVVKINNDDELLSQINNFVHVYNSFNSIKTTYTTNGKVTLSVNKIYSDDDINKINNEVNLIYNEIIDNNKTIEDNVKAIHDYIINNTKYNVAEENIKKRTASSTAVGVFINNLATCNGYTDATSLLLDKLGVRNVRISNNEHIWNLLYINNSWLHMDLTWDDPVNNLNKDVLLYDYYLKSTSDFDKISETKPESAHNFDRTIYNFAL